MREDRKRRVLASLVCGSMLTVALVGGTFAYLTDADKNINTMTFGDVKIDQLEYERAQNADGTYETDTIDGQTSYVLKSFTQDKALLPIVGDPSEPGDSPAYAGWDETTVRMNQVDSYGGMQVFAGKNAQDKFVTVENVGKSEAYVRTLVAIEVGSTDGSLIGTSSRSGSDTAPWVKNDLGIVSVDGNNYMLCEYVYRGASDVNRHVNGVLPAGDTTYPSLCQVYLKYSATSDDCEKIDGNDNGKLDIIVLSQAVQVDGFANAKTALDTAFGVTNEPNFVAWLTGTEVKSYVIGDISTAGTGYGSRNALGEITVYENANIVTEGGGVNVCGTAVFNGGSVTTNSTSTSGRHVFYVAAQEGVAEGKLTINDGEFTFSPDNLTRKGYYICADGEGASVTVNGGTFHKPSSRDGYKAGISELNGGTVTIYGGSFQFDPTSWVADGYQAVKGDDGYWTVSAVQ